MWDYLVLLCPSIIYVFNIRHTTVGDFYRISANILCRVWPKGNSSSTIFKKVLPMFVATFVLKGGLYHADDVSTTVAFSDIRCGVERMFEFELMLISALVKCSLVYVCDAWPKGPLLKSDTTIQRYTEPEPCKPSKRVYILDHVE